MSEPIKSIRIVNETGNPHLTDVFNYDGTPLRYVQNVKVEYDCNAKRSFAILRIADPQFDCVADTVETEEVKPEVREEKPKKSDKKKSE